METFLNAYHAYLQYLWQDISAPTWRSFFWWTTGLSVFFFLLEIASPWRKQQAIFRKDFWLDLFYIYFNFFIFSLIFWYAGTQVLVHWMNAGLAALGYENQVAKHIATWPAWAYVLLLFVVGDFISWNVHRLLHRVGWLWEFHKLHHSVEQMGFAAHVRYHWMENVVYWSIRVIPMSLLGFDLLDLFVLHVFNVAWGHFNHANITVPPRVTGLVLGLGVGVGMASLYADGWLGWLWIPALGGAVGFGVLGPFMRQVFNSPEMHIWHHAHDMPEGKPYGINFGITLAIWDYIWGTAHVPSSGRDIRLGFPGVERFPSDFFRQLISGFGKRS